MGDRQKQALRTQFDSRLKLDFLGAKVTTDAGLFPFRELDEAFRLKCMIMTADYTLVYKIVFAGIDDPVTSGTSVKILIPELRQRFEARLGLEVS